MGIILKQTDGRSQLQEKLAAELQERAKQRALETELPDGVTDSAYLKQTQQTDWLSKIWFFIVVAAVGIVLWLAYLAVANQ